MNPGSTNEQKPERIERDIEATRAVIKEDLRALGEKVSPEHLKQEAVQAVKDKASGARDAIVQRFDDIEGKVQRVSHESRGRLEAGVQRLKRNPLALAGGALVVGLGIGLVLPTTQAEARALAKPARKARAQAREILQEGRETTRRVRDEMQEAASEAKDVLRSSATAQPH